MKGDWLAGLYILQFSSFGMGYFFATFLQFDKALVTVTVVAVALSVTSGNSN